MIASRFGQYSALYRKPDEQVKGASIMDSITYELRKRCNEDLRREAEACRFAMNFAFSHPAACDAIAANIWVWLSQLTNVLLKVIRREEKIQI